MKAEWDRRGSRAREEITSALDNPQGVAEGTPARLSETAQEPRGKASAVGNNGGAIIAERGPREHRITQGTQDTGPERRVPPERHTLR